MNISIYTITYNEERMLPFFLSHYEKFASKIVIYDNESTDSTVELARKHPLVTDIFSFKSGDTINDGMYIEIKNSCWKNDVNDYVMIVDIDELIYHDKDIIKYLEEVKYPVHRCVGYNMIAETFPNDGTAITDQITQGVRDKMYDKPVVINPKTVKKAEFELGAHMGKFEGEISSIIPIRSDLKMLHYKNLGFEYRINRHKMFAKRLSDYNKQTNAGIHYTWDEKSQKLEFDNILNNAKKVI